jgi:hypothetical protein
LIENFDRSNPYEWLKRYKVNQPTECRACGRSSYYNHPALGELCAVHLLDLANVGELEWKWCDWEDVWKMMGRLLARPYGGAETANHVVLRRLAILAETSDGWKTCSSCKVRKEIQHYSKNKHKVDGYNIVCKPCDNSRRKDSKARRYKK